MSQIWFHGQGKDKRRPLAMVLNYPLPLYLRSAFLSIWITSCPVRAILKSVVKAIVKS